MYRKTMAVLFTLPIYLAVRLTALFLGKSRAVAMWGPAVTWLAKQSLRFWVPQIEHAGEFDRLRSRFKFNLRYWRKLFDIQIVADNDQRFELRVANCPFCELLIAWGLPEMAPHVCEGDWAKARENAGKWAFERRHEIGRGDSYCDHTYKRVA